jgi:hypothetical protein
MATTTPNYSFKKPTVSGDSGVWGGYLNENWTSTDSLLGGGTAITGIDINSGTIDNAPIGATTPNTGAFTTLGASSTFTLGATAITATGVELNYSSGVSSAIQTQLNGKLATPGSTTGTGALVYGTAPTLTGVTLAGAVTGADQVVSAVELKDYSETANAIGSIGGGTQDIDLNAGNSVSGTVDTGTTTFTFSNPPASGKSGSFTLILTNGGSQTVNWPASVDWAAATAPTLTAAGIDILTFITVDGGTIWYGFLAGAAMG